MNIRRPLADRRVPTLQSQQKSETPSRAEYSLFFLQGTDSFRWSSQVPGVLAVGGVYIDEELELRASDYASGYQSPWFNRSVVPTVCGLVGMQPRAQYLMLPVPPRCEIDVSASAAASGDSGDGTGEGDGWALFSGTSAAAPQAAGAAALIIEAVPGIKPNNIIESLANTATDIVAGHSFPQRFNQAAAIGPDNATGWGLINASEAVKYAIKHFG